MDCSNAIISEDYADFMFEYNGDQSAILNFFSGECIKFIDTRFAVGYMKIRNPDVTNMSSFFYSIFPRCFGLMDSSSMEASGIINVQRQPVLSLRGAGVLVGVIDTGIDYTNPLFQHEDGTTRIAGIWDQTIEAGAEKSFFDYGAAYTKEEINQALQAENPYDIVPSRDTNGHGTFLAGIAAGGEDTAEDFVGAAPEAELVVVKLKKAKKYLREYYEIPDTVEEVYQENDIMIGILYLLEIAAKLGRPISICIGVGTNSGNHAGLGFLDQYINTLAVTRGISISAPVGNEGNAKLHFSGEVNALEDYQVVELNVGENNPGFIMELWGKSLNTYAVGFETPGGEFVDRIPPRINAGDKIQFVLERSSIFINYRLVEDRFGDELIFIRFRDPTPGIWRIRVYAVGNTRRLYNIWLPINNFIAPDTYFLRPEPDVTLTGPGASEAAITVAAYNHYTQSLYLESGRGFTSDNRVKPDLTASGVDVVGPGLRKNYVTKSGTSVATAHVAGAAALLLEWSVKRDPLGALSGTQVKRYLLRGAKRNPNLEYPNNQWGYGILDLYNVFESITQRS